MTFADDDVRLRFHALPTQTQVEWTDYEEYLAQHGRALHILDVQDTRTQLEVSIRVNEKLKDSVPALG